MSEQEPVEPTEPKEPMQPKDQMISELKGVIDSVQGFRELAKKQSQVVIPRLQAKAKAYKEAYVELSAIINHFLREHDVTMAVTEVNQRLLLSPKPGARGQDAGASPSAASHVELIRQGLEQLRLQEELKEKDFNEETKEMKDEITKLKVVNERMKKRISTLSSGAAFDEDAEEKAERVRLVVMLFALLIALGIIVVGSIFLAKKK
ncbi:hypothetical protein ADUPG1_000523 [Aduncisulcus paluster]|uniref:Uncharacterized protein n=1 Tax=Aduncisulcus paluster TaxID=2918883 RepID=A0ABQ5KAM8_9EUKA|nr:hypothetical protein ADUPG1_000523 [Aduncisulcus paluster]|eukprot:gnl/Carplike_NY0171/776_a1069_2556.p1 GENE.gnl/Carplike_NY0171/776_a1069_2556~~gnl/Carplike_NY0171/776_a1069_2556.p1  ORF type:complete len:206 (-),score=78.62 gnl/Carplike_NY0171/776_a1069_2556:29-646(-)